MAEIPSKTEAMYRTDPVMEAQTGSQERTSRETANYWPVENGAKTDGEDKRIMGIRGEVDGSRSRSPIGYVEVIEVHHSRSGSPGRQSPRSHSSDQRLHHTDPSPGRPQSVPGHVDGICDPGQSSNLTVHLNMDIREDLDEEIENFCRLYRTGSFVEARSFFDDHLAEHLHKPWVFVIYAEMLHRQGSYREICDLDARIMANYSEENTKQNHGNILKAFWDVLIFLAGSDTMRPKDARWSEIVPPVIKQLQGLISESANDSVGSVEIAIISLIHKMQVGKRQPIDFLYHPFPGMVDTMIKTIYDQLLREGRVWDMCGLLEHDYRDEMSREIFGYAFPESVGPLLRDWMPLGQQDSSTTLALLEYITGQLLVCLAQENFTTDPGINKALDCATSLATWIAREHPRTMKSRGYVRWLIAKAYSITARDPGISSHRNLLRSSPGVVFEDIIPRYIPTVSENPGWQRPETLEQMKNTMKLAVNAARDLEDYETESLGLKLLISVTNNPESEFKELCELQNRIQGDMPLYIDSLVSSYLWSTSDESKSKLKEHLAEIIFNPNFKSIPSPARIWMANKLFHALEKKGPRTERASIAADDGVQDLGDSFLRQIEAKIPDFHQQVKRRKAFPQARNDEDNINKEQGALNEEKTKIEVKQAELDARRRDANAEREQLDTSKYFPNELRVILPPDFSDRKKIKLSIENMDDAKDKKEVTYQHEAHKKSPPHLQGHYPELEGNQPHAVLLTLRKDSNVFDSHDVLFYSSGSSGDTDTLESEMPTPKPSRQPTRQHDRSVKTPQLEKFQSSKIPDISSSDRITHSNSTRRKHAVIYSDPPLEQSSPIQSAHGEQERYSLGDLDEDQITVLEVMAPDEDRLPDPTSPETQSDSSSHSQVRVADNGADTEGVQEPAEQYQVDSAHVKQMSREPSIEPVRRRPTMPTVEDEKDTEN